MSKRTKLEPFERELSTETNQEGDRISDLPDAMLLHILSFLEDSKQVVRTSVLSKRWLPLWTQLPKLTITESTTIKQILECLQQYLNLNISIHKFHIHYRPCWHSSDPRISKYVEFAVKKKVQDLQLHLNVWDYSLFPFPDFAYCNSSLISLSLANFSVVPKGGVSWTSLKSLSFCLVTLGDDALEKILVGCPMLEFLKLHSCYFPNGHMDIKGEVLKELVLSSNSDILEISAPNLQYLYLEGFFHRIRLRNVSSLFSATLTFCLNIIEDKDHHSGIHCCLHEFFQAIRHITQLRLSGWVVRVLSMLEVKGFLASLECLKDLTLFTELSQLDLPGVLFLLKGSPNIEKLLIHFRPYHFTWFRLHPSMRKQLLEYCSQEKRLRKSRDELSLLFRSTSAGLIPSFPHLKSVKIIKLGEQETRTIVQLVQFLLYNAQVLELVAISIVENLKSSSYPSRLSKRFTRSRRWFPHIKILIH